MFGHIENLKLIDIIQGISSVRRRFVDRPSHALIFKPEGESRYRFGDKTLLHAPGTVLFVPQGESYEIERMSEGRYLVINFRAVLPDAVPTLFSVADRVDYPHLCHRLRALRVADTAADRYRCLALFYEILADLCEDRPEYHTQTTRHRIDPAVAYLKENLFDPALRIGQLHTLCGLSDTYFRKIFISRFGVSPKKYVMHKRLTHAKAVIDSGECGSIAEAALLTGFDDPLYFSKAYKAQYGHAPSK